MSHDTAIHDPADHGPDSHDGAGRDLDAASLNRLAHQLFWASLALSLAVAAVAVFPVNRWLIARGRGHAVVHGTH